MANRLDLFQGYGVELEYMLVDRDTLQVRPIVDELIKKELGVYGSDVEKGMVTWSNELVLHVVELKSTRPESDFIALEKAFTENITAINDLLRTWNAMLMPSAAHPFMDPQTETRLWPHDNNEVYAIYNTIFDCRGHGWSNLQSTHLNLPFGDDVSFGKLHAAIRIVLPLLPALCASSPVLDGKFAGHLDTRLTYYRNNQSKIPAITGHVIPEPVFTYSDYEEAIYKPIQQAIAQYDKEEILDPVWVNSRGAISRFDRGSIEIRIMDIQECPKADLAIVALVTEILKALVNESIMSFDQQKKWKTESLVAMFDQTISHGQDAVITDQEFLLDLKISDRNLRAGEVWEILLDRLLPGNTLLKNYYKTLRIIIDQGTLSQRMLKVLRNDYSRENIRGVYSSLSRCLAENKMFEV